MERSKIRNFLSQFFPVDGLGDAQDIFSLGYVNSLFAMQLVMFLEKEFNLTIDNTQLDLDNLGSVAAMVSFIQREHAAAGEIAAQVER
jgi:acyl carrier protein